MGVIGSYSDDPATTDNDRFLTYASDGSTKLTPASNIPKYMGDGWILSGDSWTYSSYNSSTLVGVINANSGANTKYSKGMFVRFVQPTLGTKYGRILSATTTSITVKFLSGTILSNEAITSPVYSTGNAPNGVTASSTLLGINRNAGTTLSTTWTDFATLTQNSTGGELHCEVGAVVYNANSGANRTFDMRALCDGVAMTPAALSGIFSFYVASANPKGLFTYVFSSTPSAGSHTLKLQLQASNGSAVISEDNYIKVTELIY